MQCPNCKISFYPQMQSRQIGENGKGFYGILYWQNCPKCKEFIICFKQTRNRIEASITTNTISEFNERDIESATVLFPN